MKHSVWNYRKLLIASVITRFGDSIDAIAFSWLVYKMTGKIELMGGIFAISVLPNLIILPFGGVIADTMNKKVITVLGDIARGLSVAAVALLFYFDALEIWHLFFFVTLNSLFESLVNPARGSMLQSLIDPEDYVKGSSFLATAAQVGTLVGLALASVLIGAAGIWGTIMIDALTFFISAFLIFLIVFKDKRESVEQPQSVRTFFTLILEGFDYLKSKKILFALILVSAFINFAFVPYNVLRPVYVEVWLKLGVEGMSYLGISLIVGMMFGGILMGTKGKNVKPINAIGLGLSMMGLMYMLLGLIEFIDMSFYITIGYAIAATFFFGFFVPVINAPMQAAIMKTTAPDMIGRLTSIMGVFALAAMPLGGAVVSLIGDSITVTMMFTIMGLLTILISVSFWAVNRKAEIV